MRLARLLRHSFQHATKLDFYSEFHPSPLSIQQYLDFGRSGDQTASYLFLRKELLVRLANIMKEISLLPTELLQMPSARMVQDWYQQSFVDLLAFEKAATDHKTCDEFNDVVTGVLERHRNVVETMAEGLMELKQAHGVDVATERSLQYFLDRLYINRISIRMLMNQHLLIFGDLLAESPRFVGSIDPLCDVVDVVSDAYENARFLCDRYYLCSPKMTLESKNADDADDSADIQVVYIPSHLYHIVFELLKNALRAVVEYYGPDQSLPDLRVFVCKGKEDLSIKICDRGGGVPRSTVDMLFNYMYTTAPPPTRQSDMNQAPLVMDYSLEVENSVNCKEINWKAGYGYGLPLARLYARYFQGEVFLVSMEGYGTDACIYLKALAVDASELLPVYSTVSRRNMRMGTQVTDWSHSIAWSAGYGQQSRPFSTLSPIHSLRLPPSPSLVGPSQ